MAAPTGPPSRTRAPRLGSEGRYGYASAGTILRHVRPLGERRPAHFKVGRKVRISRAELAAWLDRSRVERAS